MRKFRALRLARLAAVFGLLYSEHDQAARATELVLFGPPQDIALADSRIIEEGGGTGVDLYSRTGREAHWFLGQWQIAGGNLHPFELMNLLNGVQAMVARAPTAEVTAVHTGSGLLYTFVQNGATLPCQLSSGRPREFGMHLTTNTRQSTPREPAAAHFEEPRSPPISDMTRLVQEVGLRVVREWMPPSSSSCEVNQGNVLVAVVLNNNRVYPAQLLFYQVSLHLFCPPAPSQALCQRNLSRPFFWSRGDEKRDHNGNAAVKQFGYDQRLPDFGQPFVPVKQEQRLVIDLLPKLRALITSGTYGIDPDLNHWFVGSAYQGQSIWGVAAMSTEWHDYRLMAVLP